MGGIGPVNKIDKVFNDFLQTYCLVQPTEANILQRILVAYSLKDIWVGTGNIECLNCILWKAYPTPKFDFTIYLLGTENKIEIVRDLSCKHNHFSKITEAGFLKRNSIIDKVILENVGLNTKKYKGIRLMLPEYLALKW